MQPVYAAPGQYLRSGFDGQPQQYQYPTYGVPELLSKPASASGKHRRVNVASAMLSFLVPWLLFVVLYGMVSFSMRRSHSGLCWFIVSCCLAFVGASAVVAVAAVRRRQARDPSREPTWSVFLFTTSFLALALGIGLGDWNYVHNMEYYYDMTSLATYPLIDPSKSDGLMMTDAGRVMFSNGSHVDVSLSMGFKNDKVYCVAPITSGDFKLASYDFWAGGIGCCTGDASADFHCDHYDNLNAHAGLRVMRDDQRTYFQLAVQQAEATYGIRALHPLFFTWTQDPIAEINIYHMRGSKNYFFWILMIFGIQMFLVALLAIAFSRQEK